ncbi:hypothetical protein [Streptacidiphilus rugosus]|uniref:hypothetical protein n=1 Tax=Streptacidiphilus rugosus TaxID=405783 RepID=UPI000689524E|nr:hypothetical protein [Streptacidiphilus rugosus]
MTRSRSFAFVLGGAALLAALAGCADPPVGTVSASNGRVVETISNPPDKACHLFAPIGVSSVFDNTLADMRLYPSADCTGHNDYLSTETSVGVGANNVVYRSYSFVGQ